MKKLFLDQSFCLKFWLALHNNNIIKIVSKIWLKSLNRYMDFCIFVFIFFSSHFQHSIMKIWSCNQTKKLMTKFLNFSNSKILMKKEWKFELERLNNKPSYDLIGKLVIFLKISLRTASAKSWGLISEDSNKRDPDLILFLCWWNSEDNKAK